MKEKTYSLEYQILNLDNPLQWADSTPEVKELQLFNAFLDFVHLKQML